MSPLGAISGQPEEEVIVDSPGSFSIISLSSASPANSDLNGMVVPPPPMNTPAKSIDISGVSPSTSPGNTASLDQLLSCFYPFNRLWPFNWNGPQKEYPGSDNEAENLEISLESIQVNFKEDYCGGGTSSSVFRGKWKGQWIALKKLNRASEVDIKRLCNLDHPNVIKTLGVCTKDIYPCIVMEYCEKGGLFDYLRRTTILVKSLFLQWSIEVANGMAYLHELKIVHRDLKSPNILVDNRDTLKICDFGSLYTWDQKLNSQNQTTIPTQMDSVVMSVCGTSQWMSPEMMKNEPCNEKVDVWSYGVVLWELLTGEVPFEKIAPMAVCFGVGSDRLRLIVPRTAPESVKFLLKLCWAKKPRNRPSFMSILNNLNNLQAELGEMQEDGWTMRRELWRREIAEENAKLMLHNSGGAGEINAQKQKEEELIQKRMHELRHAQEIRQLFDNKKKKVDSMMRKINRLNQQMEAQKKLNEQITDELNNRIAHNNHWHQILLQWNAALREITEKKQRGVRIGTIIAELNYLVKQAEEAKKTAIFLHKNEKGGNQQKTNMMVINSKEETRKIGRPAILKMTYFDYDENGRRIGIEQRVVDQQQHMMGNTFGQRKSIAKCTENETHFYERRRNNSSTSSCSSDDGKNIHKCQNENMRGGMVHHHEKRRKKRLQQNAINQGMDGKQHPIQHQNSLISTCPSECSSLANAPINNYLFSRNSSCRHSADPQSPVSITQTTPKSVLSRDDSAISSIMPFSPSDRSLQNLTNNNAQSIPHHPISMPTFCINCQSNFPPFSFNNNNIFQQQFFSRNSIARASGLSVDSGVCPEENNLPSGEQFPVFHQFLSDVQEEKNGNILAPQLACCLAPNSCQCPQKTINRNEQMKSSKMRRTQRRTASQIPFVRESPFRTAISSRRVESLKRSRNKTFEKHRQANWQHYSAQNDDNFGSGGVNYRHNAHQNHHHATLDHTSHRTIIESPKNRRLTELREQQSSQEYPIHWFSSPELCQFVENNLAENSPKRSFKERDGKKDEEKTLNLGTIEEMTGSQLTDRAIAAEKTMAAMLESSSTMVSSLERSLEMAVTYSDGLSDRETKLREAKTTFKLTHRRTASNPTNYPRIQQQKSTDGSNSSDQKQQSDHQKVEGDDEESSSSAGSEDNDESLEEVENEDSQQILSKNIL